MKDFFKDPFNVIGSIAVIFILIFVIIFTIAFHNMLIDHYCNNDISISEAYKDPRCKPYLR